MGSQIAASPAPLREVHPHVSNNNNNIKPVPPHVLALPGGAVRCCGALRPPIDLPELLAQLSPQPVTLVEPGRAGPGCCGVGQPWGQHPAGRAGSGQGMGPAAGIIFI